MMRDFIEKNVELWNEDIGEEERPRSSSPGH